MFRARASTIVLAAVLAAVHGCSDPDLEPWHTSELSLEFTADQADSVRTLEDYRRLEDRLFAQMEEEVYTVTGTGPEFELFRYSAGSAADPLAHQPDWNRTFDLTAPEPKGGVLLLHGMSDSPYSLHSLGEAARDRGFRVVGLRIPGHGTIPSGLVHMHWKDAAAAVRIAMRDLASDVGAGRVHLVGYSTGAALALDYALEAAQEETIGSPGSLVLISPAVGIHAAARLAWWKNALAELPGLGGLAWLQILPEFDPYKYNSFATNAGAQVKALTQSVTARLRAQIGSDGSWDLPPVLVFKSTVDATVSTRAVVDDLLRKLASDRHELVLYDINRSAVKSTLLVSDPGPLTQRLMDDDGLPFAMTLVTNERPTSSAVVARHKPPRSSRVDRTEPLGLEWPVGVISLSHVALPFAPDDPLYGTRPPDNDDDIFLGEMAIRGERGLMKIPDDWLLRLRHNPFYDDLEARALAWIEAAPR